MAPKSSTFGIVDKFFLKGESLERFLYNIAKEQSIGLLQHGKFHCYRSKVIVIGFEIVKNWIFAYKLAPKRRSLAR